MSLITIRFYACVQTSLSYLCYKMIFSKWPRPLLRHINMLTPTHYLHGGTYVNNAHHLSRYHGTVWLKQICSASFRGVCSFQQTVACCLCLVHACLCKIRHDTLLEDTNKHDRKQREQRTAAAPTLVRGDSKREEITNQHSRWRGWSRCNHTWGKSGALERSSESKKAVKVVW